MKTFLVLFAVFAAVVLLVSLLYWAWSNFFDGRAKAKKERLQSIRSAVQSGGTMLGSALSPSPGTELENWLRSSFKAFAQLEMLIKRAHSLLTATRLIGLMLLIFTGVLAMGLALQINLLVLFVLAVASASAPVLWLFHKASKRGKAFGNKLPETLDYISRALRASHSLNMAISMVGKEFPDPIGTEFKLVSDKISFGIPFKDAISQLGEGIQNKDINFFVVSILIQHETGGNLTELLDGLASTMRERIKLRGKIRTLSAEGRASAWILGSLPFVLTGLLSLLNPVYVSILWTSSQGRTLLLIGGVLLAIGLSVLRRLVQIKV